MFEMYVWEQVYELIIFFKNGTLWKHNILLGKITLIEHSSHVEKTLPMK